MRPPRLLLHAFLAAALPALAQPAPAIGYTRVADALKALEARDGDGTVVTHSEGWVVVNEPLASAQWSFTPAGHYAHPAVVKRTIVRGAGGAVSVDVQALCEAPAEACGRLKAEFEAMNDRITQAVRARGRQPQLPPPN